VDGIGNEQPHILFNGTCSSFSWNRSLMVKQKELIPCSLASVVIDFFVSSFHDVMSTCRLTSQQLVEADSTRSLYAAMRPPCLAVTKSTEFKRLRFNAEHCGLNLYIQVYQLKFDFKENHSFYKRISIFFILNTSTINKKYISFHTCQRITKILLLFKLTINTT